MSEITNEMKAKCMGEFKLSYEDICPKCVLGDDSPCMCNSDQNGVFTNTRAVPWDLCKQIFKTMYALSPAAAENAALKKENERLKAGEASVRDALDGYDNHAEPAHEIVKSIRYRHDSYVDTICDLKARVAELEGLVRDIRQHDINETTKRLLEGGRKFNYSLPLSIRERIAAALKEPANEG